MFVGKNFRLHQEALKEILNIITFYNIWIGSHNIVKILIYLIYRFIVIPSNIIFEPSESCIMMPH